MTIQIIGGGCANCRTLEENARAAAAQLGVDAQIEKVTDSDAIMDMGVLRTPGIAFDGELASSGSVNSVEQIVQMLQARSSR